MPCIAMLSTLESVGSIPTVTAVPSVVTDEADGEVPVAAAFPGDAPAALD
jgi:hypothetical protein